MADRTKAPRNCFKRGNVWWFRAAIDGREVRESLRTSSRSTAERRAKELLQSHRAGAHFGEKLITWNDAVASWADHIGSQVGPLTAARYATSIKANVNRLIGSVGIADITARTINEFVAARRAEGVSSATIRRDLTAISSVLEHAIEQEWRETNPARDKQRRVREPEHITVLPPLADIEFVLSRMTGRFPPVARFALAEGTRLTETLSAKWSDYDAEAGRLYLAVAKGKKPRSLTLSAAGAAIIRAQPRAIGCPLIFQHDGEPFRNASSAFSRAVKAGARAAKLDGRSFVSFTFHDLRHVFAVTALRTGRFDRGIYGLQQHLGHKSVSTTEVYLRFLTPEEQEAARTGKVGTKSGTRQQVSEASSEAKALRSKGYSRSG